MNHDWKQRLVTWVNGEAPQKDQTLFQMEQRTRRTFQVPHDHDDRDRALLERFLHWYPLPAALLGLALMWVLIVAVVHMPLFGLESNPTNNEIVDYYLEYGREETGASNTVTAIILSYRGFDTLGESCVLFLAVNCVMMLLETDRKHTSRKEAKALHREDAMSHRHPDPILHLAGVYLSPFLALFSVYVLAHGETSPGGGFAGGTILGASLILYSVAHGHEQVQVIMNRRVYVIVRTTGLMLYALLYGYYIFIGANGLENHLEWAHQLVDLAVGLVVACTVYGFYALFARGEL